MINPMNTESRIPEDDQPIESILLDGAGVNYNGLMDDSYRPDTYTVSEYPVYLPTGIPAVANQPNLIITFKTGRTYKRDSAVHCIYWQTDCWTLKILPRVDSISVSSGALAGGQEVTISGNFKTPASTLKAYIGGEECDIQSSGDYEIVCNTATITSTPSL